MMESENGSQPKTFVIVGEDDDEGMSSVQLDDIPPSELLRRKKIIICAISSYKKCISFFDDWINELIVTAQNSSNDLTNFENLHGILLLPKSLALVHERLIETNNKSIQQKWKVEEELKTLRNYVNLAKKESEQMLKAIITKLTQDNCSTADDNIKDTQEQQEPTVANIVKDRRTALSESFAEASLDVEELKRKLIRASIAEQNISWNDFQDRTTVEETIAIVEISLRYSPHQCTFKYGKIELLILRAMEVNDMVSDTVKIALYRTFQTLLNKALQADRNVNTISYKLYAKQFASFAEQTHFEQALPAAITSAQEANRTLEVAKQQLLRKLLPLYNISFLNDGEVNVPCSHSAVVLLTQPMATNSTLLFPPPYTPNTTVTTTSTPSNTSTMTPSDVPLAERVWKHPKIASFLTTTYSSSIDLTTFQPSTSTQKLLLFIQDRHNYIFTLRDNCNRRIAKGEESIRRNLAYRSKQLELIRKLYKHEIEQILHTEARDELIYFQWKFYIVEETFCEHYREQMQSINMTPEKESVLIEKLYAPLRELWDELYDVLFTQYRVSTVYQPDESELKTLQTLRQAFDEQQDVVKAIRKEMAPLDDALLTAQSRVIQAERARDTFAAAHKRVYLGIGGSKESREQYEVLCKAVNEAIFQAPERIYSIQRDLQPIQQRYEVEKKALRSREADVLLWEKTIRYSPAQREAWKAYEEALLSRAKCNSLPDIAAVYQVHELCSVEEYSNIMLQYNPKEEEYIGAIRHIVRTVEEDMNRVMQHRLQTVMKLEQCKKELWRSITTSGSDDEDVEVFTIFGGLELTAMEKNAWLLSVADCPLLLDIELSALCWNEKLREDAVKEANRLKIAAQKV